MSDKMRRVKKFDRFIKLFRCPYCAGSLKVDDYKSLTCLNNHTFDFSKAGYVNLMTRPTTSPYNKSLFEARQKIIMESNLYTSLHKMISRVIKGELHEPPSPCFILDAGCGEGSHLHQILHECSHPAITGVGLDLAKDGILLAAKTYKEPLWIVGDLAKSPLEDQSFHLILNMLSPSNYQEFKRILVPHGLLIKVVPRPNYLIELREALFKETKNKHYKNDQSVELFKHHFHLKESLRLRYTKKLNQKELEQLVRMSPLSWTSDKATLDDYLHHAPPDVSIDLDILIGSNIG